MGELLYTSNILDLCRAIPRLGRLEKPDGTATKQAKLCGSVITVDVKLKGEQVTNFAHAVEACALGKAAASYLARHVIGKNYDELKQLRDLMHDMLEQNGLPPQGEWEGLKIFESMRDYPERHASTLLTFDATVAAIENALQNCHSEAKPKNLSATRDPSPRSG